MPRNEKIKCPNCGNEFPIEDAISKQLEEQYKKQYMDNVVALKSEYNEKATSLQEKEVKLQKFEQNIDRKAEELVKSKTHEIEKFVHEKVSKDFKDKIEVLNKENEEISSKVKKLSKAEAENEKLKRDLKTQKEEIEIEMESSYTEKLKKTLEDDRKKNKIALKKKFSSEYQDEIHSLKEENQEQTKRLKEFNSTRIENEKLKRTLDEQKQEIELEFEQKMSEELSKATNVIRMKESEKNELKLKESNEINESLKRKIEELQKKAEQGSMQMQGEVQEIAIEEILKEMFIFDIIEEVQKGVRGADIIQTVRNKLGQEVGKIVYESKRTKHFSQDWIKKVKDDTVAVNGDISVIITEAMPKDIGLMEGVWICSYNDFKGLSLALRDGLLRIGVLMQSQTNKGDKMQMLYDYLTGNEFVLQINTVINSFNELQAGYNKEKSAMERIWKTREKQLQRIILNTNYFIGSIQGIAGDSLPDIKKIDQNINFLESSDSKKQQLLFD